MDDPPTTPTKVRKNTSSIPSPKAAVNSPRQYKRRYTTTPPFPNDSEEGKGKAFPISYTRTLSNPLGIDGNSHLTSFYKENIRELNKLQDILFQKKALLDSLTDELSECKAKYEDLEFKRQTLREEKALKHQQLDLKSNELIKCREEEAVKKGFMDQGHQLHLQQLKAKNEADLNRMANEYRANIEVLKFTKIKKFQRERDVLLDRVEDARNKMLTNQETLQNMLREYDTQNCSTKEQWLQEYQQQWKRSVKQNEDCSNEIASLSSQINKTLAPEAEERKERLRSLNEKLNHLQNTLKTNENESLRLKNQIIDKSKETTQHKERKHELEEYIRNTKVELEQIDEILIKEETMRRTLHNELQELRGNIRVFCRIRPPLGQESSSTTHLKVNKFDDDSGIQTMEISKELGGLTPQIFKFDRIFDQNETNSDVFEEICQLVQSSLDGYNVCIFAYGQTGSGKTYTMLNPRDGIIPATISHIFSWIESLKERGWKYEINCQFVEIYNETIVDLLRLETNSAHSEEANTATRHEIRHNQENRTTTITNVTTRLLTSRDTVEDLLKRANRLRSTASTAANERSSRSHSIFIIHLSGKNNLTGEQSNGILNLVDLAGSERINTSQVVGERLRETQNINRSLSCLGDVVHALASNDSTKRHIPFRNSKLTYLLQYSLTGNSKTLMFVNISACLNHINENLNSLRFASKVNSTKMVSRNS